MIKVERHTNFDSLKASEKFSVSKGVQETLDNSEYVSVIDQIRKSLVSKNNDKEKKVNDKVNE